MKKFLKILLITLLTLIIVILAALGGFKLWDWLRHFDFYQKAEVAFPTPGANDGFVQQGFDYVEEEKAFLATGYMADDTASRVYVIREDGEITFTQLKKANGSDYTGHTGGIAHFGEYVYITGSMGLDVFSYEDVMSGKESTKLLGTVKTYNDPAHCYIHNGYLMAGSFYIEEDYPTSDHEWMQTPSGETNPSIITAFKLEEGFDFGVDPTPKAVISTRRCVQGMCITDDGKIVLSTSYGLSTSQLFVYDGSAVEINDGYTFEGVDKKGNAFKFENLKLCYLDEDSQVEVIKAPPMSEELVYLDGKIYILTESASNKYIFGKITTGYNVYAYPYED